MSFAARFLFLLILIFNACSADQPTRYTCESGQQLDVLYRSTQAFEKVEITIVGQDSLLEMSRIPSASGVKYSNSEFTWWTKGNEAFMEKNDEFSTRIYSNCISAEERSE